MKSQDGLVIPVRPGVIFISRCTVNRLYFLSTS